MISGSFIGKKLRRHTSGLDLDLFTPTLLSSAKECYQQIDTYRELARLEVKQDNVKTFFEKDCGFSPRLSEKMFEQFQEEVSARGRTAWAVLSALSYYASHGEPDSRFSLRQTGNDNEARSLLNREMDVQRIISGLDWQRLAA